MWRCRRRVGEASIGFCPRLASWAFLIKIHEPRLPPCAALKYYCYLFMQFCTRDRDGRDCREREKKREKYREYVYLVGSCGIYVPLTFLFQLPKWVCPTILWPLAEEILLHPPLSRQTKIGKIRFQFTFLPIQ